MKRLLLSLSAGLLMVSTVFSQSFVVKDKEGNEVTGQTIDHYCAPSTGYAMVSLGLDVFNVATTAKNVKVRKYDFNLVEGSTSSICWASCYQPNVFETPEPILIEPGTFSPNFTGDLSYGAIQGTSTVKFVFFDIDNSQDSSFVVINFIIGTLGVNNPAAIKSATVSNAYPNPAVSATNIDYRLPSGVSNAKIKINTLLGTTIREISLSNSEGKAQVDVTNLPNGIYVYTLFVNNSAVATRKFVVQR